MKKGFTLVEMLVVLAIFGTAMVVASDLFLRVTDTGRRVELLNRMQGEVRFALEKISREVRTGRIDYPAYGGPIGAPSAILRMRNAQGAAISFSFRDDTIRIVSGGSDEPLLGAGIIIDQASFYIDPPRDPFSRNAQGAFDADTHPRVTIAFRVRGTGLLENTQLLVQTTVSSRYYAR